MSGIIPTSFQTLLNTAGTLTLSPVFQIASSVSASGIVNQILGAQISGLRDDLKALPAEDRYDHLKEKLSSIPGLGDKFETIDKLGPDIQNALAHAVTNNEHFAGYLAEKSLSAGASGNDFISQTIDDIILKDDAGNPLVDSGTGEFLLDSQKAGALQDILNSIGNNPDEDFGGKLDRVADAAKAYGDALVKNKNGGFAEEQQKALKELVLATRAAGANIHAFAGLGWEDLTQFLDDLFSGRGADFAIGNLIDRIGLEGEQLAEFQEKMAPLAKVLDATAGPYIRVYQEHEEGIKEGYNSIKNAANSLSGNNRIGQFSFETEVRATTGNMSVEDFGTHFRTSMRGVDLNDPDQVLRAMSAANHNLADEVAALSQDPALKAKFSLANMNPAEVEEAMESLYEKLQDPTQTVKTAVTGWTHG